MVSLGQALERRRAELNQFDQASMKHTMVETRVKIQGSGEASFEITFPVVFSEKPLMTFGHELADNHSPEATNFPVCSATVLRWNVREHTNQRRFYIGCDVGAVTLGRSSQQSWVHLKFEGMAFRDPTLAALLTDEEI